MSKFDPTELEPTVGLCWTILHLHNFDAMERIADARLDRTYGEDESELKHAG